MDELKKPQTDAEAQQEAQDVEDYRNRSVAQPSAEQVASIREAVGMTRLESILKRACSEGIQVLNEI